VKLRITRLGLYVYRRSGTLSFGWKYRMPWRPEWSRESNGWFLGCWRVGIEWIAWDADDPWGERRGEDLAAAWQMMSAEMWEEKPLPITTFTADYPP